MPRSLVVDDDFSWRHGAQPRLDYADTVIYEAHVKGFTMRHPQVPPELRGTIAVLRGPLPADSGWARRSSRSVPPRGSRFA